VGCGHVCEAHGMRSIVLLGEQPGTSNMLNTSEEDGWEAGDGGRRRWVMKVGWAGLDHVTAVSIM